MNSIVNSEIDFLIWATPYKQLINGYGIEANLPSVCIFDLKNMKLKTEIYKERRMVSTEP